MEESSVAFDESGNTGPDLLNAVQPVFALATVHLDEAVAADLGADVGSSTEAEFSELRRDSDGRERLLRLLGSDALTPETARVSVFHKPYTVVAKMVDFFMEPAFAARGMGGQFILDEGTMRWPTTLYELAPAQLGESWDRLKRAFITAVRQPSPQHTAEVEHAIEEALAREPDERVGFPLLTFAEQARYQLDASYVVDPLDPAIPALIEHIDYWGQSIGPFVVKHDHTTALERAHDHLVKLCDPNMEPFEIPGSDRPMRYPLKALRIDFVDSKDTPQVQIADLLAGACSFQQGAFESPSRDAEFAAAVAQTGVRRLFGQFVAPPDFVRRSMAGSIEL